MRRTPHRDRCFQIGNTRLTDITRDDVVAFVSHRRRQGCAIARASGPANVSHAEINRELQVLESSGCSTSPSKAGASGSTAIKMLKQHAHRVL